MKTLYAYLAALAMVSCGIAEDVNLPTGPTPAEQSVEAGVELSIPTEFGAMSSTRALDETQEKAVQSIDVLVFPSPDDAAALQQIIHVGTVSQTDSQASFGTRLPAGSHNIVVLANASSLLGSVAEGDSYAEVRGLVTETIGGKMYESGGAIPMWGQSGAKNITEGVTLTIDLYRSVARIDVGEGEYDELTGWAGLNNFDMTEVYVMRPNKKYGVIPIAANLSATPPTPSVPGGTTSFTAAESVDAFKFSGADLTRTIYVPEAEIVSEAHEERMALVVGGKYNGSGTTTYYRVDFNKTTGGLTDVVRNRLYRFDIRSVRGTGLNGVVAAYESHSSNMVAGVIEWDDEPFDDITFEGDKYIGVRGVPAVLSAVQGATHTLTIRTNVDAFTMTAGVWSLSSTGGSVDTDHFHYELSGSAGDYTLTITTRGNNIGGGTDFVDTWEVNAGAGRLEFDIEVRQPVSATDPTPHNVVASAGTGGSVVANRATAAQGDDITIQATPAQGMVFAGWNSPDGSFVPTAAMQASTRLTFEMPATAVSVMANFAASEITVNGTTWSNTNLAANGVFAESALAYGALFQWGSSVAYSYTGGDAPSTEYTNTNATWPDDQNPCPANWRLPTNVEVANLLNLTDATTPANAVVDGAYTTITPFANGVFRITPKNGDTDKTLIFPAGGIRSGSSSSSRGSQGLFWSSVESSPTAGRGADFDNNEFTSGRFNTYAKFRTFSVRCVRESGVGAYKVNVAAAAGGSAMASPAQANAGQEVAVQATPSSGMIFAGWTASGITLSAEQAWSPRLTFAMPGGNVTLTPSFTASEVLFGLSTGDILFAGSNLAASGEFADSAADPGALFQWGNGTAYDYGSTNAMSGPIDSNSDGKWDADQNPCPGDWRLPTNVEWANMLNLENGTTVAVGVAGGTYSAITPQVGGNGPLRITPKSGDTGKTLILPAAGQRTDATSQSRGGRGFYWSSAQASPDNGWYVHFDYSYTSGWFNNRLKSDAQSVRCVRTVTVMTYVVSALSSGNGSAKVTNSAGVSIARAEAGQVVTFTATPDAGYKFSGWTVNSGGIAAPTTATATVTIPTQAVSMTANFEEKPPIQDVQVGNLIWAGYDVAASGTFATEIVYADNYKYVYGDNPCPSGWRVPRFSEMEDLVAASTFAYRSDYLGTGINGGEYTINATGETLFFPASGFGGNRDVANYGVYGSTDLLVNANHYQGSIRFSTSTAAGANTLAGHNYYESKSIRCVQDLP